MALMARPRRALGILILMLIAVPAVSMPFQRTRIYSAAENRVLARQPAWPQALGAWATWPKRVDTYLGDHFGFRESLVAIGNRTFGRVPPPGALPPVLDGRDGRLFLVEGLLASTGHEIDPALARDFASFTCDMAGRVRESGAKLVLSLPPSPAEIYPENAPDLALPVRSPTNYDLVMAAVRSCGAPAVDLRPALRDAKRRGQLYQRTDTHWTPLAALIAYDQVVAAMGRPDFAISPESVRWTPQLRTEGDLPRLAALPPIPETVMMPDTLRLPDGARLAQLSGFKSKRQAKPISITSGGPGPRVLIVGDSFTEHYFPPFFSHVTSRVVWVHSEDCRFDWNVVRAVKPDFVLLMPTERYARCPGGGRPSNYG
jgi:hypothetical protein